MAIVVIPLGGSGHPGLCRAPCKVQGSGGGGAKGNAGRKETGPSFEPVPASGIRDKRACLLYVCCIYQEKFENA